MKKVKGQFIGKVKISLDSKYIKGKGIEEDIEKTKKIKEKMKQELKEILEKYKKQFRMYETAEDIYLEALREEAKKILKRQGKI